MTRGRLYLTILTAGIVCLALSGPIQPAAGQAFAGAMPGVGVEGGAGGMFSAEDQPYADGTRAINDGRWADAQSIFSKIANEHSEHSDGALYWKAYAENKMGQTKLALATCTVLKSSYPGSSWIHECGALRIEIHARSGQPAEPNAGDDDDLKLLALNALMQKDETRALGQIQEILSSSDSSEKLRKEALFILGQHYSDATYAQVVRLSYVEGDVRVTRGAQNEKPAGPTWERAVADVPLETGFSVVTGEGRAVIEFEDASTVYLGENSVLTFNDLHTQSGIPHTEMALLTGTATLRLYPSIAGESFVLRTPTDELTTNFPHKTYLRVNSYSDAMALTSQDGGVLHLEELGDEKMNSRQTTFYRGGLRVNAGVLETASDFSAWDKWVADRVEQRKAAYIEVMKASGLTTPIPGLAEMKNQGTFFECAPYGTCWEPKAANGSEATDEQSLGTRPSDLKAFGPKTVGQAGHLVQASLIRTRGVGGMDAVQAGTIQSSSSAIPEMLLEEERYFPCMPAALLLRILRDQALGIDRVAATQDLFDPYPYRWAVCHSGSWIQRRHHYVWVVGHKIHHLEPVRWVKSGRTVAFVPIHPYDVKGRPPINQKEEVFAVNNKNGLTVEKVKLDASRTIEWLQTPPKEYRTANLLPLARADVPRMESHSFRDATPGKTGVFAKAGIPLTFDPKAQSFMMAHQVMMGNKNVTVMTPVGNRSGNLQARGGSFAGGHGNPGGGGVSSHGGGGGGSASGGGSHGGGGGGGGSTGGGSSVSASTAASSASSASSGAASSSGGHH